jgi:Zn-dependent peptidase ImmA (M78 family)
MMGARPLPLSHSNRRTLNTHGMHESIRARAKTDAGLTGPLCIYKLCEAHGVVVRFVDVNMEGMYQRSATPRIFISSLRPVARRAFNCAHELGHHLFGHGSTVDQLYEERSKEDRDQPNEVLVNAFAAFTLMPTLGLRDALTRRKLNPARATPEQLFAVASNFGVGYSTLVNHMAYGVETISPLRANELLKSSPKTIRASLLGAPTDAPLVVADEHWNANTLDLEVDALVLLPTGVSVDATVLAPKGTVGSMELFQALAPGIRRATVPGTQWATFIRVSRKRYVGLAKYRHLEDLGDD